jgi:uncharacterized protein
MKKLWIILAAVVLATGCSSSRRAVATTPKQEPLANSLLWEISGHGLQQPSYLFGTMHILCADDAMISDSLQRVLNNVRSVCFEINMNDMSQMMSVLQHINMTGNTKLADLLTKEEYEKIKRHFAAHPPMLPFAMMERFKPYFIVALMQEQSMPCPEKKGMEQIIMDKAKEKGLKFMGLETAAFQASIFDSIPYKQQAQELLKLTDSTATDEKESNELREIYKNQDLAKMQALTIREDGLIGSNLDVLLYNRNARWAKQIDSISHDKATLFAVGAAHLPGDRGVIRLLQSNGYTVRPIKN